MNQHKFILFLVFMIASFSAICQIYTNESEVLMSHRIVIDETIYEDVKGTPYVFDDFVSADILDIKGNLIKNVSVNYNAFDHGMVVSKKGDRIILDEKHYPKITIKNHNLKKNVDGPLVFVPFRGKSASNVKYVQEIVYSPMLGLYKKYRVAKKESTVNAPGEIITQQKFNMYKDYIIFKDGEYIQVKRKVDDFIKIIGYEKELKSFAKKNKIKLKTDQQAKELIEYALTLQ